jgi:hypothetical protein
MFQLQSWQEFMMLHTQSFKKQYVHREQSWLHTWRPEAVSYNLNLLTGGILKSRLFLCKMPGIAVATVGRGSKEWGHAAAAAPSSCTAWTARRIDAYYLSSCLVFVVERTSRQTKGDGGQLLHNMRNCYWFRTSTLSHTDLCMRSHTYFRTCMCAHTNSIMQIRYDPNAFELTRNNTLYQEMFSKW